MRKTILIADDLYVRSFLDGGAFEAIEDAETSYLAAASMKRLEAVESRPGYAGAVPVDPARQNRLGTFRIVEMASLRNRSETMAIKTDLDLQRRRRWPVKAAALPGIRRVSRRLLLARAGRNDAMDEAIAAAATELVIAPTAGTDTSVWDAISAARRAGAESLVLVNGWDNLSSKAVFPELPDYMGVWGPQAVEHAIAIHGMERDRVFELGAPTFAHHFSYAPETHPTPYEWPYVLFAGCALAFDELSALHELERTLAADGDSETRIVYRPHPWRHQRACDDVFDPADFERVVLDRQIARDYEQSVQEGEAGPDTVLPSLDYYPALLGNAELVVCPLSTMIVESLIVGKRVLALTYDDGVHRLPPSTVARFTHFHGLDRAEGVHLCPEAEALAGCFRKALAAGDPATRDDIRYWLHFDEKRYAGRLARVVEAIGRSSDSSVAVARPIPDTTLSAR